MEGHNYVTSGWVQEPLLKQVSADTVIVNHSQSLSAPPVKAWILAKSDGEVVAAHCLCMAGNGEVGSHVAALLFYLEEGDSCTDVANSWLPPHVRKIVARPVAEMDFSSSTMKKILDGECRPKNTPNGRSSLRHLPQQKWNGRACNGSDLRLIYDCTAKNSDYKDLMQLCDQIFDSLVITKEACESIETRSQALSAN
ncbi:hypothetical protein HPB52_021794 [Rhipicephalus sanguineus]|uniref:Uncharacterized protein n=1 Tax=Rhipicephalus sanguineus TaxID=34632 RepID=A0A9D4QAV8_RHISA|nr:hypothetical protein HPB52_021794 [Rhipicephalus sanguineus]